MQFSMKNLDQLSLSEMKELLSSSRKVTWKAENSEARVRVDCGGTEGAGIPQAGQAWKRDSAPIPAKGHGNQPRPIDEANQPVDGGSENRAPDDGTAKLHSPIPARGHCAVGRH